jgi:hypothetical protein
VTRAALALAALATPLFAQTAAPVAAPTPMAERVATLAVLNKQNGRTQTYALRPGTFVRSGALTLTLRACETTPPWDRPAQTGAFVQVDERLKDGSAKRRFSGWLFAESPSLNVFDHPVYDVWVRSCTMRFPETGPETVVAGSASKAPKSADMPSAEPSSER